MTGLRISQAQFNALYPDLEGLYDHFNNPPPAGISDQEFETRYLSSKLWRLNNIYSIIDKAGNAVIFKMNYAQHVVYATSRVHPRVIILKSRQQGISTLWLVSFFDDSIWQGNLNLGLMAQGTDEASTLLERTKFLWDNLAPSVKEYAEVNLDKDNSKEFSFSNNSKIFIRVSFRSATLQRLHISEFGKIANQYPKRAKETKTGSLQALAVGNTGVIESTAEGRNEFKFMWDAAMIAKSSGQKAPKDFWPVFLPWLNDPDCVSDVYQADTAESTEYFAKLKDKYGLEVTQEQKNFWIIQYRELKEDIYQEYPATPEEAFAAVRDGTFYAKKFNYHVVEGGRIKKGLYDPNLATDIYFDLGVDDYFVMGAVQWYRGEFRIVWESVDEGKGFRYLIKKLKASGLDIRDLVFPHDMAVRELGNEGDTGDAKSRLEIMRDILREEGLRWGTRVLKKTSKTVGIENTRSMIENLWIDASCTYLMDCFLNYSKKYDERLQRFTEDDVHDEYSHGADVLRGMATGVLKSSSHNRSTHDYAQPRRKYSGAAL